MGCQGLGVISGPLIDWAAGVIGIPCTVVRAQLNAESGGQPGLTSSAGAEGPWQFLPSTWSGLGCTGSFDDPNGSTKCYAKYMYQLMQQYHGNVRDALAAYNAGPLHISAGYGYADGILAAAGQPQNTRAAGGTGAAQADTAAAKTKDQTAAVAGTKDPACAWGVSGGIPVLSKIPIVGGKFTVDVCFVHKTTIRHAVGGLLVGAGFLIMLPGVAVTVVYGFRASGAARTVSEVIAVVPGGRRVAGGTQAAGAAASRAASGRAQRIPRGRVAAGGRRPRQIEGKLPDTGKPQQIEGTLPS